MPKTFFPPQGSNTTSFNEDDKKKGFQVLDNIEGLAQKNLRMMQFYSLVLTVVALISVSALGLSKLKERLIPIVVTVSPEGKAEYVGKIDKSLFNNQSIPENAKYYQLKKLVKNMYSIVTENDICSFDYSSKKSIKINPKKEGIATIKGTFNFDVNEKTESKVIDLTVNVLERAITVIDEFTLSEDMQNQNQTDESIFFNKTISLDEKNKEVTQEIFSNDTNLDYSLLQITNKSKNIEVLKNDKIITFKRKDNAKKESVTVTVSHPKCNKELTFTVNVN